MTVVKADAYGHGLKQIAALLMQSGTDVFGVANLTEAESIRSVGRGWPILMLGACLPEEVERAVMDDVKPTISSSAEVKLFSLAATRLRKTVRVHLKVNTGMGRLGAEPAEVRALGREILAAPGIQWEGIYTHYAAVEDDVVFSKVQAQSFARTCRELQAEGMLPPVRHCNNSGGILYRSGTQLEWVRPGLLVYGIVPRGKRRVPNLLNHVRPALSWKCRVSFVKTIAKGYALSYGRTFTAPTRMSVATLTAGYGDGYLRAGSQRAFVLIGGRRCRVLGRITMDQMLVDVSKVRHVQVGDEAVLIGEQGSERITAAELAKWFGTIPWEVLTAITYRVPRVYRGSQAA